MNVICMNNKIEAITKEELSHSEHVPNCFTDLRIKFPDCSLKGYVCGVWIFSERKQSTLPVSL